MHLQCSIYILGLLCLNINVFYIMHVEDTTIMHALFYLVLPARGVIGILLVVMMADMPVMSCLIYESVCCNYLARVHVSLTEICIFCSK